MFFAMSQNRPTDAVPLFTVRESDVLDGKDCFKLALQILGAISSASSRMLRSIIETTIHELSIRDPDITLAIPRHLSRLSSMPFSSIVPISNNR
jgi:hypothetical protein